jgi:L-asparaginase
MKHSHNLANTCFAAIAAVLTVSALCAATRAVAQTASSELPLVWVLSTGGTIAGSGASETDLTQDKSGSILGEDMVNAVPEIKRVANVKVEQVINVPSPAIALADWLTLANRINQLFSDQPALSGIVLMHGTDTLEETAYFLNLTVKFDRPVVVVGAMPPASAVSADGPLNLLNAVRVASAPEARGKGVLVVMNEQISTARDVTKTSIRRVDTFHSPELGFLGYVDEDKITFFRNVTKRHTLDSEFDVSGIRELPQVEILYSYVQPSTVALRALIESGVPGIVFAGLGNGTPSEFEKSAIEQTLGASRPVLVRSSRVGNGRVIPRENYDALGMIPADTLNPQKARILLMLALTKTRDLDEIQRMFTEY